MWKALAKVVLIVFTVFAVPATAQSAFCQDYVPLGTVVYSVLDETTFAAVNGLGWALLNGDEVDISDSDLCREANFCSLPDARGVFIRGMNLGRSVSTGDPDGNRLLGAMQGDAFKTHNHTNGDHQYLLKSDGNTTLGAEDDRTNGEPNLKRIAKMVAAGSNETRPRNIALYTYVKVDR